MLTGLLVNFNEIPKVNCIKVTHFFILPHKKSKKKEKKKVKYPFVLNHKREGKIGIKINKEGTGREDFAVGFRFFLRHKK